MITRRRIIAIVIVAIVAVVLAHVFLPALAWDGAVVVDIEVLARDHSTGEPVEGTTVVLARPGASVPMGATDDNGLAALTWASARGER